MPSFQNKEEAKSSIVNSNPVLDKLREITERNKQTKKSLYRRIKRWYRMRKLRRSFWLRIKNYFFPHNVLKLRNCPRGWMDRSEQFPHAVFSLICDFVEKENGGREKFADGIEGHKKYLAEVKATTTLEHDKDPEIIILTSQIKSETTVLEIYDWYLKVDWEDPEGINWETVDVDKDLEVIRQKEEQWDKDLKSMLMKAIEIHRCLWT